jgi:hypothetical protein
LASFAELGFVCGKYRNRSYAIRTRGRKALGKKLALAARILAKKQDGLTGPGCGAARVCDRGVDVAARGDVIGPHCYCALFVLARGGWATLHFPYPPPRASMPQHRMGAVIRAAPSPADYIDALVSGAGNTRGARKAAFDGFADWIF